MSNISLAVAYGSIGDQHRGEESRRRRRRQRGNRRFLVIKIINNISYSSSFSYFYSKFVYKYSRTLRRRVIIIIRKHVSKIRRVIIDRQHHHYTVGVYFDYHQTMARRNSRDAGAPTGTSTGVEFPREEFVHTYFTQNAARRGVVYVPIGSFVRSEIRTK